MNPEPAYILITPVRNEQDRFQQTVASVVNQTVHPRMWIIVDDGSTDETGALADQSAQEYAWIRVVHRTDRGFRKQGGGVIEAFYDGYRLVENEPWDFLGKLDGDLSFDADYFARSLEHFAQDPKLGIGGGTVWTRDGGRLFNDGSSDPRFHVRGATKIYRRSTWEAIGGLMRATGWDTLDEVKANMLGWRTYSFPELKTIQLKSTGSADGTWKNWFKNGVANYMVGYHPLFMGAKCLRRLFERPYFIVGMALGVGYLSGYWKQKPRETEPEVIRYLRRQQLNRLLFRTSLWN
ncbi:MAG TPA: glycosyltransferase family A protein [Verrucomicrobiae bacterium]|nr:glycosyltransferase family A protein [Verrucomicrobiae bacterium]